MNYLTVKPLSSYFMMITANFSSVQKFINFTVSQIQPFFFVREQEVNCQRKTLQDRVSIHLIKQGPVESNENQWRSPGFQSYSRDLPNVLKYDKIMFDHYNCINQSLLKRLLDNLVNSVISIL